MRKHTILCLYQNPAQFDAPASNATTPSQGESQSEAQNAKLLAVHSTLRLWGESYVRCASEADFRKRLEEAAARREECLIVMEGVREGLLSFVESFSDRVQMRVLLVTADDAKHTAKDVEATLGVNHFLSLAQGHLATTSLISSVKKWTTRDVFGVEKYLTYGTPIHFFTLGRSNERTWLVETLTDFVAGLDGVIPSGARDYGRMAGEVLDELLMNAIWDANPARAGMSRDQAVILKPSETVRVEWGVDGNLLAVSVTDPFGTIDRDSLKEYRHEVLNVPRKGTLKINTVGPGAGIGLHMVIRRVSGLVINMNPGVSTEFVALFDITRSPRYLSKGPKVFHFFSL